MKSKIISALLLLSITILAGSCKKTSPVAYSGKTYVEFYSTVETYAMTNAYSEFYYLDPSKTTDTVYIRMKTIGAIPTKQSFIRFKAYNDPSPTPAFPNAVEGTHYVSFNDPSLQALWKVDAGKYEASVPFVLKRDPSLKNSVYQLRFSIINSDDFLAGSPRHIDATIFISDRLSQPSNWTNTFFFLGNYGTVKHQFMVAQSGKKWDAAFITSVLSDSNMQAYYLYKFTQDLKTLNAARLAAGLTELRENPALASTAVTFPNL